MSMFNHLLSGKVKITALEGANWDSKIGVINYSEVEERLLFKEDIKNTKFQFDIIEMSEANMTFKTPNGLYSISPVE